LACCTTDPRDGEVWYIALKRSWSADPSRWVVEGGNEDCIAFRKIPTNGPLDAVHTSIPRWRWAQMMQTNQVKYLGREA